MCLEFNFALNKHNRTTQTTEIYTDSVKETMVAETVCALPKYQSLSGRSGVEEIYYYLCRE
jgi:hypothetical protein